jgi:hypothetical protein
LAEWDAFARLEGPINVGARLDVVGALLCLVVARSAGAKGVELDDFLLRWDPEERSTSDEQIIATLRSMMKPKEEPSQP